MKIIKLKFLKNEVPSGREYTYFSNEDVSVGDTVQINESAKGVVTAIDVPEEEIESFKDRVKTIFGKAVLTEYNPNKSIIAQAKYCKENEKPHFAPADGICFKCNKNIYSKLEQDGKVTGITVQKAESELITGCPHCMQTYCD